MFDPADGPLGRPRAAASVVALFDGRCGVCSRSARLIAERDRRSRVERLDLRDAVAADRFPDFSPDAVRALMHAVDAEGTVYVGIDAVLRVFDELPRWSVLARLLRVPGFYLLASMGYQIFARNRLWFNRWLPAPEGAPLCQDDLCAVDYSAHRTPPNHTRG